MGMPVALLRCDASPLIGAGHAMRCLALAEVLSEQGWRVTFVVGSETVPTVAALVASPFNVRVIGDKDHELAALREEASGEADLLVVDHYERDAVFERACRSFARKILVLDDSTGREHDCDILVDTAAAGPEIYDGRVPVSAQVLTGPTYALTRQSFVAHRETALARRDGRPVTEILVSCGATDPANATAAVLDSLDNVDDDIVITVVLSSRAPHIDAMRKRLRGKGRLLVDVMDMAELVTIADLAFGASGSSAYERAVLGLPSILVTIADNQRGIARQMTKAGAAVDGGALDDDIVSRLRRLGSTLLANGAARQRQAHAASALVDGRGTLRIALATLDDEVAKQGARIRLRLADSDDEGWLLKVQQHPLTRRFFLNAAIPTADEHHDWMRRALADPRRLLLIVEANGEFVGSVRLDRLSEKKGRARHEVSIAIDPMWYGRGIGSAALRLVRTLMAGAILDATILPDNKVSRALFAGAGFAAVSGDVYRNSPSSVDEV
jgi:UDP-2,4-diacetamido-2,4,6-trideoxy-beta-L-altropyranose hydrolase